MRNGIRISVTAATIALVMTTTLVGRALAGEDQRKLHSLHNDARAEHGVHGLAYDPDLEAAAKRHSDRMAADGRIYHSSRLSESAPQYNVRGENVGTGSSVEHVFEMFMGSESHRANILDDDFEAMGAGVTWRDGSVYVSVLFGGDRRSGAQHTGDEPESSPEPSARPHHSASPQPTSTPEQTATPQQTAAPQQTATPQHTREPEPETTPTPNREPEPREQEPRPANARVQRPSDGRNVNRGPAAATRDDATRLPAPAATEGGAAMVVSVLLRMQAVDAAIVLERHAPDDLPVALERREIITHSAPSPTPASATPESEPSPSSAASEPATYSEPESSPEPDQTPSESASPSPDPSPSPSASPSPEPSTAPKPDEAAAICVPTRRAPDGLGCED